MWFREYKVWCVSVRKRTHIHCIFTVSFPRKWWKYKKIVILSKTFQLNNLSRRMIMKITIWSTYNNFFVFSSLAGNIQWICVRFRTETHQTLYSLNHIFLMTVFWSGVLSIYVNSRCSLSTPLPFPTPHLPFRTLCLHQFQYNSINVEMGVGGGEGGKRESSDRLGQPVLARIIRHSDIHEKK